MSNTNDKQDRVFFKRKRAGVVLSKSEVIEIKAGRAKLRADMKETGVYSRKEFELTASSLGLYFDKNRFWALFWWLLHGRALWALLGAAALLMVALYIASLVTEMRGHFTINLTDEMFEEGFELSHTEDFEDPSSRLFGEPVEDAPCISVTEIPADVHEVDGSHNGKAYFAHTFYLAKRGKGTVDYRYTLSINSESMNCSTAIWVLVYHEGNASLYALANGETEQRECLPAFGDDERGYRGDSLPFLELLPSDQYELMEETANGAYYRLMPSTFRKEGVITTQVVEDMEEDEVDKFTVVIWLEGDDPDCTNDLIGSHIGMQMDFELIDD